MKKIWNSFLHSIRLPQKKSVFYLNRIGMDINVIYMFILLAIASSPALLEQITSNKQASQQLHPFFLFIYFFIFYYLIIDRKSTRLNSSHVAISYSFFCL